MSDIKKRGVIYTCITGNYDRLNNHTYIHPDWDYFCFTDDMPARNDCSSIWRIKPLVFAGLDNVRNNRWHKLHPHLLFPEYERSVYVDAHINFLSEAIFGDIDDAVRESRKISPGLHCSRNCIYDELEACLKLAKDNPEIMKEQVDLIRTDGFPEKYGLFENGIIYREHHDKAVIEIMNDWWRWIENYSRRDQLSFTYVLWKHSFPVSPLSNTPYRNSTKISMWHSDRHITKEESVWRRDVFAELFKKVKERVPHDPDSDNTPKPRRPVCENWQSGLHKTGNGDPL